MKSLIAVLVCVFCLYSVYAQNLVANGGFEEISGKLKEGAKVDVAANWYSLTATGGDIFAEEAKEEGMKTPDNRYGREKPFSGNNYAGFTAFSYKAKAPRSYLSTELVSPLVKGKKYCVRFQVSLSDISKFGVNNIGAHLSQKEYNMSDSDEPLLVEANIMHSKNKVIETTVYWEPICGVYTAEGGERFLIIGNFYADKGTKTMTMKKAPQFKQAQIYEAYYFVDEVSVEEYAPGEGCSCEKKEFVDVPKVVHKTQSDNVSLDEMNDEVANMKIQFDSLSAELKGPALDQVKNLLSFMKSKSTLTIVVMGHASDREIDACKKTPALANLSANRAKVIGDFLIKNGIDKTRVKTEGVKNTRPFVYGHSAEEQYQNCAANIEIVTE